MKVSIGKIVVQVTEIKTYEVVISADEGFDMPETVKDTVNLVNNIHNDSSILELSPREAVSKEIVINDYRIEEGRG